MNPVAGVPLPPWGRARIGAAPAPLVERHRNGLMHVFVAGGGAASRREVVSEFHHASPLSSGPVVHLDARRDDAVLRAALERWIAGDGSPAVADPLTASSRGTLFVDCVESLGRSTQRLLLILARQQAGAGAGSGPVWGGRLMAGSPDDPAFAVANGRLSPELRDCLDKIRVNLRSPRRRHGGRYSDVVPEEEHARRSLCG